MKRNSGLYYFFLLGSIASFFVLSSCHSAKKATKSSAVYAPENNYTPEPGNSPLLKSKKNTTNKTTVRESPIIGKYASQLGVSKHDITNYKLYNFIDEWYGTPYKYAGRTKSGVDCTDLASLLFQSVYGITISGTVTDIYRRCKPIAPSELKEGDLLFFKINSKSLSHVAIYLQNHKFVHASVHAGVVIDDLDEDYYKKYFWGAARLLK